jgi:NAD(P)-dependent dehydrogenase (short-subunit alcohol dehydrogenase family)
MSSVYSMGPTGRLRRSRGRSPRLLNVGTASGASVGETLSPDGGLVTLKGHFAPTKHAALHWRERSRSGEEVRGRVINTSSPSGIFGNVGQANYSAAKAGIAMFTVVAAQELARYGVTVNCIAPNARTRMTESAFELPSGEGDFDPIDPGNNASVVVALASDAVQGITGQVFHIFGGAVSLLQGWEPRELFLAERAWDPEALVSELVARLPEGAQPEPLPVQMERVGGSFVPSS